MSIKYMSHIFLTSFLLCCVSLSLAENYVASPSMQRIEENNKKIARHAKTAKLLLRGAQGSIALLFGYYMYRLFKAVEKVTQEDAMSNEQLTNEFNLLNEKYKKHFKAGFLTKQWFENMGHNLANGWLFSALSFGIWEKTKYLYNQYGRYDNFDVFMNTTHFVNKSMEEVLYNAQLFDEALQSPEGEDKLATDKLILSCNLLVYEIESVIAFMEYRLSSFAYKNVALDRVEQEISDYIFERTNEFCETINELIKENSGAKDSATFFVVAAFREDISRLIELFRSMERRIVWELL